MTDEPAKANEADLFPIDLSVARLARVENFLAGGDAHFAIDRATAEALSEATLSGLEGLRGVIEAMRDFVGRAVRVLVRDAGARQFLQIAMATPSGEMTHHVAWQHAPDARFVYASYDPTTLAHVHELRQGAPEGAVAHVHSTYDDTDTILRRSAETLDFGRPVEVILPTTLCLVPDDEVARRILDDLHDAITPGSHLVFAHTSLDLASERSVKLIERLNDALDGEPYVSRTRAEIERLLDRFELLDPGLVPVEHWRNDSDAPILGPDRTVPIFGALARRP